MNNEKEIIETEVEEKETLEGEVVEEVFDDNSSTFDPNVILNTIMQSQDAELRGVLSKLSILNLLSKASLILILLGFLFGNFFNYIGVATTLYGLYSAIYVLIHYKKIKEHESSIRDIFSKTDASIDLKKMVIKNLIVLLICIPLAAVSIWYRVVVVIN